MLKFNNPEKIGYLQTACNKYGDFKVSTRNPDGTWSKHYSVLYCWHNLDTEGWRLDLANNRTAFPYELILDFDLQPNETSEQLRARVRIVCHKLRDYGERFKVYFSGSKGYHIHIIIPDLDKSSQALKDYTAKSFGCDAQVVGKAHMIALENTPHWKTGNKKEMVEWENL